MKMKIEDQLRALIVAKFGSLKKLTEIYDIPYSTLQTVLKRGVQNAGIGTLRILSDALDITLDGLSNNLIEYKDPELHTNNSEDYLFLYKYNQLDKHGKELVNIVLNSEFERVQKEEPNNVIIFPMFEVNKNEKPTKYKELDYYPMAAGMGNGRQVENAIPEKISYPESKIPVNTDFVINVSGNSMEPTFSSGDKLFIQSTDHLNKGEIGVFNYMGEQLVKECGDGYLISHNKEYEPIKIEGECYVQGRVLGKLKN